MDTTLLALLLALAMPAATLKPVPAPIGKLATVPGTCAFTRVAWTGYRLRDPRTGEEGKDTGSAVVLANGVYGVDYVAVPAVDHSRVGDHVMTCLASVPHHCPAGDHRGKVYTTTNLRTGEAWSLPDAEHQCGGA